MFCSVAIINVCFLMIVAVKVRVLGAHDKGSHAEVDVKVLKVLWDNTRLRLSRGNRTLYPESWTSRGCTCPVLFPG